jgi:hypothetical protein
MDDLESSAFAFCSHLSKTIPDWVIEMTNILVAMKDKIPSTPTERFNIYKNNNIPEVIYISFDREATEKALARIHAH